MEPAEEWLPTAPVRFAGVAPRALALLVDLGALTASWSAVRALELAHAFPADLTVVLGVGGALLYFPLAWGRFGTTFGMRLVGLRIARGRDGTKIGYRVAAIRFVGFFVSIALCLLVIGLLFALPVVLDPRRRAIHDRFAGTVVLQLQYRGTMWPIWWS